MEPTQDPVFAAPSADNGNLPLDTAPSQPEQPQQPVAEQQQVGTVAPEQQPAPQPSAEPDASGLYDLPDGRKVDAETLAREWKENFLPDYTRKSQILARQQQPTTNHNPEIATDNPYADPNYIPRNYDEVIEVAKARALQEFEQKQNAETQRVAAIEAQVVSQLTEIKTVDPNLNENALFLHATKYGFQDLKTAYQNMKDMNLMAKNVQQQTQKNIQQRANEPVSTTPGQANGSQPNRQNFQSAQDYLRSIK